MRGTERYWYCFNRYRYWIRPIQIPNTAKKSAIRKYFALANKHFFSKTTRTVSYFDEKTTCNY